MKIGTCNTKKGELAFGVLPVTGGIELPIAAIEGNKPGKTCFISGGMHGDEINGVALVQNIMHHLDPARVSGRIIFLPLLNPSGFFHKMRQVWEDKEDLNRSFAGPKDGAPKTTAFQIAETLFEKLIPLVDFGIDCHDSGKHNELLPQPRIHIDRKTGKCADGCTLDLGKLFGTIVILEREGARGMMAVESYRKLKKPVLTFEVGGGMVIHDDYQDISLQGMKNVLADQGFIEEKIILPAEQFVIPESSRARYIAPFEGLLEKRVAPGSEIHKGSILAVIHNVSNEKTEEIVSEHCGFVFSVKHQDKTNRGETLFTVLQTKQCKVHETSVMKGSRKA